MGEAMKSTSFKTVTWFILGLLFLAVAACGRTEDGTRGLFGTPSNGGQVTQQSNSTTGLYCIAEPLKTLVKSEEAFQVRVTVYNSTGTVRVVGFDSPAEDSVILISTSYNNKYGTDVQWQPTLTVQDTSGTAKCGFKILVQSTVYRRF